MNIRDRLASAYQDEFSSADYTRALLFVVSSDGMTFIPASESMFGSAGNNAAGTNGNELTAVLSPQTLGVGANVTSLTVPAGANVASVHVVSGAVRWSLGGVPSASTPLLSAGDSADLAGAELGEFRMVRDGGTDAQVYVSYGVVG